MSDANVSRREPTSAAAGVVLGAVLLVGLAVVGVVGVLVVAFLSRTGNGLAGGALPPPPPPTLGTGGADAGGPDEADSGEPPPDDQSLLEAMRLRYRVGPFVSVVGMLPDVRRSRRSTISWLSRSGRTIPNPWLVAHGEIRPRQIPAATGETDAPTLAHEPPTDGSRVITVLPGVPNQIEVRVQDAQGFSDVVAFIVGFERYLGHFYVPVGAPDELGTVVQGAAETTPIAFGIDAAVLPDGSPMAGTSPFPVNMYVAAVDREGHVSNYVARQLNVLPVGTGDVEVTLTMSEPTDLDLYVQDPSGNVIYYRNTSSFTGGHLDLDANAACASNLGVNNEHVYWSHGQAPAGTYAVRVANYQSCIQGRRVEYTLTVRNCGETAVLSGRFEGAGVQEQCIAPPGNRPEWCQDVVTFQVTPCASM